MSDCNLITLMMLKLFTKNLPKKKVLDSVSAPRSDNVTNCIYVYCSERQRKTKNTFDSGERRDDENKARKMNKFNFLSLAKVDMTFNN